MSQNNLKRTIFHINKIRFGFCGETKKLFKNRYIKNMEETLTKDTTLEQDTQKSQTTETATSQTAETTMSQTALQSRQRKQRVLRNNKDRLGLIMGTVSEIKEKPVDESIPESPEAPTQRDPVATPSQEGPVSRKLKGVGLALLILSLGTSIAHFMGYSYLPSEFVEGFISCLFMTIAGVLLLVRKLIHFMPSLPSGQFGMPPTGNPQQCV